MYGGDGSSDRQTHVIVLTRRAEFHLLGRECRGVRERGTGKWVADHAAVGAELRGSRPLEGGELWPGALRTGAALVLEGDGGVETVVSDEVLAIEHPTREDSERALGAAHDARTGGSTARGNARLMDLTAIAGLLGWFSGRSSD